MSSETSYSPSSWRLVLVGVFMKANIHPSYTECSIVCACGFKTTTRATIPEIRVDICSNCHPYYTGEQKLVDTEGRIDKFNKRYNRDAKKTK